MVLAEELSAAKDEKKFLESQVKDVGAKIETLDKELSDAMGEDECEKFSHQGKTYYLSSRLYASPIAGKKDDLIRALREEGYGDIVTETVQANTLSSFVKEQIENSGTDEMPGWLGSLVSSFEKITVGIRKA